MDDDGIWLDLQSEKISPAAVWKAIRGLSSWEAAAVQRVRHDDKGLEW